MQHKTIIKLGSWITDEKKKPGMSIFISLFLSLSFTHAEVHSLHLSKAPPNHKLLCTIMRTMRGPWPHKSTHNQPQGLPHSHHCPTLHARTHTMATPEPGVPLCNSITQRHTPVLIPSERVREKNDRGGRRKIVTLGEGCRKLSETQSAKWAWQRSR